MTGQEINVVIDNLCNKFGTTIERLIPELAKAGIASSIFHIIIFGFFSLCSVYVVYRLVKFFLANVDEYIDDFRSICGMFTLIFSSIAGVVLTTFVFGNIYSLIMWNNYPYVMTIKYIAGLCRGI